MNLVPLQYWGLHYCGGTYICIAITFDPQKRDVTLANRGLDFAADAEKVFAGRTITLEDDRFAYGETRLITAGFLGSRMVVMVWTERGVDRHIISMRYCHAKEERRLRTLFEAWP